MEALFDGSVLKIPFKNADSAGHCALRVYEIHKDGKRATEVNTIYRSTRIETLSADSQGFSTVFNGELDGKNFRIVGLDNRKLKIEGKIKAVKSQGKKDEE